MSPAEPASPQAHWEAVYRARDARQVSWYRPHLERSLERIRSLAAPDARIVDVGGGASTLVDDLLALGYAHVTVLDVAAAALDVARARLGADAGRVRWCVGDVLAPELDVGPADVWHDRAVFHFFTRPEDRARYVENAARTVVRGGVALVATFASDGPQRCSGLDVQRHDDASVRAAFAPHFALEASSREQHITPSGVEQAFALFVLRRTVD